MVEASPRFLEDEALLKQCRVDHYRGSGPGGQKRNKTSNAVRIAHGPTGVTVTATEARSSAENMLWALRRLRIELSAQVREAIDLAKFEPPDWFLSIRRERQIEASHRHVYYAAAGGLILDLMAELGGNPAAVGINLGIATTAVVKFLEAEHQWWAAANAMRAKVGMGALVKRK